MGKTVTLLSYPLWIHSIRCPERGQAWQVWYLYALHPPAYANIRAIKFFNAARVCATPSVIIARFRGWKKWQPFNRFKGFSFSATFYIVWDRSMGMLVLIRYGLSVVVARFFFFFLSFFIWKKEEKIVWVTIII